MVPRGVVMVPRGVVMVPSTLLLDFFAMYSSESMESCFSGYKLMADSNSSGWSPPRICDIFITFSLLDDDKRCSSDNLLYDS